MAIGDLFNNVNIFGAGLPAGSEGLLTEEQQKQLANQSLVQGLLGTAASYLAQPKTGRYGSALPYLGKAYLGGMQASQGAYNTALNRAFQAKALQERGQQLYNVDGALVDRQGNVVYQSPIKASQGDSPFAKIDMSKVDTQKSNLTEFSKRLSAGDPTAYDFIKMKSETPFKQTKALEEFDKKAVPDLAEFVIGGGFSDAQKSLTQLNEAVNKLENTPEGTITGRLIGAQPDWYKQIRNRQAVATKEQVEEIVQRNLRLILGAQFTQEEGKRLIERAYNPSQSQAENAKRVRLLQKQIYDAAKTKQDAYEYLQQNKTLAGFEGKLYNQSNQFFNDYNATLNAMESNEEPKDNSGQWTIVP